ncbi:hypothetical protein I5677_04380 [Mobilitalea sibirica]|uniref:Uncharacterized protein n=1 Tax=Mobilitalea sibirica TaxID=1462919 RepID=A0A8J7KSB1_9FIRM|nr:DUF5688 family protein [Mobilitalea sibirica]MBH1940131.1 hypothetical protein [Mobilitalea sibirica]
MLQLVKEQTTDYNFFVGAIKQRVNELMGDGYSVRIYKVVKNNSLELDSLVVLKEGKNFAPNIYLLPYYESYLEGTSIEELAKRLCCIYQHCSVPSMDQNFSYELEEMKPFIFYRIISYERNKKLLNMVPHVKYLDLALTYHCLVRNDDEGIGSIRITNEHIKLWDITVNELDALAYHNTKALFPATIRSMDEVLQGMLYDEFRGIEEDIPSDLIDHLNSNSYVTNQIKMYVLSNQKGINGASCLIYTDIIGAFANQINSDLYILPSSIHEIILIPKDKFCKKETLTRMVEEVNKTQVAYDEVLSNQVYLYSRKENKIVM